jgi:cell division cycle 14
LIKCF